MWPTPNALVIMPRVTAGRGKAPLFTLPIPFLLWSIKVAASCCEDGFQQQGLWGLRERSKYKVHLWGSLSNMSPITHKIMQEWLQVSECCQVTKPETWGRCTKHWVRVILKYSIFIKLERIPCTFSWYIPISAKLSSHAWAPHLTLSPLVFTPNLIC